MRPTASPGASSAPAATHAARIGHFDPRCRSWCDEHDDAAGGSCAGAGSAALGPAGARRDAGALAGGGATGAAGMPCAAGIGGCAAQRVGDRRRVAHGAAPARQIAAANADLGRSAVLLQRGQQDQHQRSQQQRNDDQEHRPGQQIRQVGAAPIAGDAERRRCCCRRSASASRGALRPRQRSSTGCGSILSVRQTLAASARANTASGSRSRCRSASSASSLRHRHLERHGQRRRRAARAPRALRATWRRPSMHAVAGWPAHRGRAPSLPAQSSKFPRSYAVASRDWGKRLLQLLAQLLHRLPVVQLAFDLDAQPQRLGIGQIGCC